MPGYRRVLDHLRIPAGGRRCHAGEAVVALPAYAIVRLGIAEPVGFSLVREPHPVAAVLFEDEGACQGVLLVRGNVDADGAVQVPVQADWRGRAPIGSASCRAAVCQAV